MSSQEIHVALPKLYGAPAYARPPRPVETLDRPLHPDDLPIEVDRTPEEHELAEVLTDQPYAAITISARPNGHDAPAVVVQGRPFGLGSLTGRLFGNG